jgi:MinD superfamily P-loop ATPase
MREVLIISGKGGTGKTSLAAAFAHLAGDKVICDLDVDAPDLHLSLKPTHQRVEEYFSGNMAVIDSTRCVQCGICLEMCRYGAISRMDDAFQVNRLKCEGCKVCVHFCPAEAIDFPQKHCGQWFISDTRFGPMVHAQLFPGQENSGRLVALLKQQARELAQVESRNLILCDGAPGIGCPVISSLSGTDLVVAVTEPTPSGRHDLERVVELCAHFKLPVGVVINKFDLNSRETSSIEDFCLEQGLHLLPQLPHDTAMTEAMVRGQAITEYQSDGLAKLVRRIWDEIMDMAGINRTA